MAVIYYTGMERATELLINKTVGGKSMDGYPHKYRLGDSFLNYIAMTEIQLAEMSLEDYQSRLNAFKLYVESVEIGVDIDTAGTYRENLISCPILK